MMAALRFKPPTTARLIAAAADCSRMMDENPSLPEALAANACLVAASARRMGFAVFRDGVAVLEKLTTVEIAEYAQKAYDAGLPDGGMETLKKSWRARRLSGCGGEARFISARAV